MIVRVVLVEPEHEGNIGGVARLMKNFGFRELFLVKPKVRLGHEAMSYACHAQEILSNAVIVDDLHGALETIDYIVGTTSIIAKRSSNLWRMAITPEELAKDLCSVKGKVALLFGKESQGLSNLELKQCDLVVSIPSHPLYRTLNLASASAIVFYELWKAEEGCGQGYFETADKENRARLKFLFDEILEKNRLPTHRQKLTSRAFKNVISRSFISKREATLITGILRRILERLS